MSPAAERPRRPLGLRAGEQVTVRSREEILATLDRTGALDGLPFMPEMLAFCGRTFTVAKRAHKTCDTVTSSGLRRMTDTVHLEGTRCDGGAHGGCEASCQIFWKEAWLERATAQPTEHAQRDVPLAHDALTEIDLQAATRAPDADPTDGDDGVRYRCQATDLLEASQPLRWWHLGQYVEDVRSGNDTIGGVLRGIVWALGRQARMRLPGYRAQVRLFNLLQRLLGGTPFVHLGGDQTRTPRGSLGLEAGEAVRVKDLEEIRDTLSPAQRNRGLYFDVEMVPFCGREFSVGRRVERIIEEKTGRMIDIPGDCVILDNVYCTGQYHHSCPRAIFPYWREIWLERVTPDEADERR